MAIVAVTAGLFGGIELGFRIFWNPPYDHKTYRLMHPPAYKDSPYWSKDFIEESFKQPGKWNVPKGKTFVYPEDYQGTHYNVKDGKRATTDQPVDFSRTVYVFGGSTVYSSEVPDAYTIPSFLQRTINEDYKDIRVLNMGSTSVNTAQQLERLKETSIKKDDIVIFYDGINDIIQGVLYGNPEGTITNQTLQMQQNGIGKLKEKLKKLRSFEFILSQKFMINAEDIKAVQNSENAEKTKQSYFNSIDNAYKDTVKKDAHFYHFLQPSLVMRNPQSQEDQDILEANDARATPIVIAAMETGYKALIEPYKKSGQRSHYDYSLTDAFNDFSDPVFLDFCHITERGNKEIAQRIFNVIKTKLK